MLTVTPCDMFLYYLVISIPFSINRIEFYSTFNIRDFHLWNGRTLSCMALKGSNSSDQNWITGFHVDNKRHKEINMFLNLSRKVSLL
jgi:hypothetical protein